MSTTSTKKPCAACAATGKIANERCSSCLGRGVTWADDRPMTKCPENLQRLPGPPTATFRACDRRNPTCAGCGRASAIIGGPADVAATENEQ